MNYPERIADSLCEALLSGPLEIEGMIVRSGRLFGKRWRWMRPLAKRIVEEFGSPSSLTPSELKAFLLADEDFVDAIKRHAVIIAQPPIARFTMALAPASTEWCVPEIPSAGALAHWLGVSLRRLDWLADVRGWEQTSAFKVRHYHYRTLAKRAGAIRLIESPKPQLKAIQRKLLTDVISQIPVHSAAHGFQRGRSILTFCEPHVGKTVVLRMDLEDFFPSIFVGRIRAIFRTAGYPVAVAKLLAGLCTNSAPIQVFQALRLHLAPSEVTRASRLYGSAHLPQGAPTSPALANLAAYRLDARLDGLARSAGAVYTRYADDLAFSGGEQFARIVHRFQLHVASIVVEEGFRPHPRKTRIMRRGVRQHLARIVVNERANIRRSDYDRLKAILHNCVRHGPESQNREDCGDFRAHLLGKISFVESVHAERGKKLRALFEGIAW